MVMTQRIRIRFLYIVSLFVVITDSFDSIENPSEPWCPPLDISTTAGRKSTKRGRIRAYYVVGESPFAKGLGSKFQKLSSNLSMLTNHTTSSTLEYSRQSYVDLATRG